jgi:dimeric dUTPase (all-alpha-NTP-PPase superfamily)
MTGKGAVEMELTPYQSAQPMENNCASGRGCAGLDASRVQMAAACREQYLDMELVTAEGDRVTLSLESRSSALAVSYTEMYTGPGRVALTQGDLFAGGQERFMNVTVEGDLNEQEKKDLRSVFKALEKMMGHFVSDRLKPMMAKASQLGNLETVAGLDVEMSYSRKVLLAEQTRITATYNPQGALVQPVRLQPPADSPHQSEDNWQAVHKEAEALTDAMAEQMNQVRAFIYQLQESVRDMFDQFRQGVAALNPAEPAAPDLVGNMYERLMTKVSWAS